MSVITINVNTALSDVPIMNLGRQGENGAREVVFDVSEMTDTYGSGTAVVVVQRRGDSAPYQHDDTVQSGSTVTWTVSNADTAVDGIGRVQLFWMVDEAVAKTVDYRFYVAPALGTPTDAPVTPGGWISEEIGDLSDLNTTAKNNLVDAINELEERVSIVGTTIYIT